MNNETNGKCYQLFRYCADDEIRMLTLDYEDKDDVGQIICTRFILPKHLSNL